MNQPLNQSPEIQIPRKFTNQLLHWAQLSPEREICGLVGSKNGIPMTCYPIDNVAEQPEHRYLLDAQQQISAMTAMRNQGETFFAIYHSHPKTAAVPSRHDIEQSTYPEALYLIISLNIKGVLEMRGFKINQLQAHEIVLNMIE